MAIARRVIKLMWMDCARRVIERILTRRFLN